MYGLYPGVLYPGLYGYLVEVPIEPERPPSTCVVSGIDARCLATSEVCVEALVCAGVRVEQIVSDVEPEYATVTCRILVRCAAECETLETREEGCSTVRVRYLSPVSPEAPVVCAGVQVRDLVLSAIDCQTRVTSEVEARPVVTADAVEFCCVKERSCESC